MLWYAGNTKKQKSLLRYRKINSLKKCKKVGFSKKYKSSAYYQYYPMYMPVGWNLILIKILSKNKYPVTSVYMYSNTHYFRFSLDPNHSEVLYDRGLNQILTRTLYFNTFTTLFWKSLIELFTTMHKPFFLKLKFKGKGYYLYKNKRGTVTPQFGYSHRLYMYSYFVKIKFLSKTSVILFGMIKSDLKNIGHQLKQMRPINIFTGRGVRFNKQVIYKKVGKVSSYR